jgi:hypothetical protein
MATKANLVIDQGATHTTDITVTNSNNSVFDLTGYTGAAQMRKHFTSSNSTSFAVSLGGNTGVITLSMTAAQTVNLVPGRYVYDVEITSGNTVVRVIEGIVTVTPNVTR